MWLCCFCSDVTGRGWQRWRRRPGSAHVGRGDGYTHGERLVRTQGALTLGHAPFATRSTKKTSKPGVACRRATGAKRRGAAVDRQQRAHGCARGRLSPGRAAGAAGQCAGRGVAATGERACSCCWAKGKGAWRCAHRAARLCRHPHATESCRPRAADGAAEHGSPPTLCRATLPGVRLCLCPRLENFARRSEVDIAR